MRYVAGFLFSVDMKRVALIRKTKPEWQSGKLNGIGGKVEAGEGPNEAMVREFREEAGASIEIWENTIILEGDGFRVFFYVSYAEDSILDGLQSMTEEKIEIIDVASIGHDVIPNLHWIIPLSMDDAIQKPIYIVEKPAKQQPNRTKEVNHEREN